MAEKRFEVVGAIEDAMLAMAQRVTDAPSYAENILQLAEARAWVLSPGQPHGSSSVGGD